MELPRRKHPRLKTYDYSSPGAYFITVCAHENRPVFGSILPVGRGLAPAECRLSATGLLARDQIQALEARFPALKVDAFVIMPTHIHLLRRLTDEAAGASPRPTVMEVVGSLKSLVTRLCNQRDQTPGRKLFQTSFYETVIRSPEHFERVRQYLFENPGRRSERT